MHRLLTAFVPPLLVGLAASTLLAAPIPPVRPVTDPDGAITHFEQHFCSVETRSKSTVEDRKRRLIGRLQDLAERLAARGETDEAAAVRDRLTLLDSLDSRQPLGKVKPSELIHMASLGGKYRTLLHVLYVPGDQNTYASYQDFGFWNGTTYGGRDNLQAGHWVYISPRWFIWKDGPPAQP
ncbi:MAG: hypothetical protein U0736_27655 [Gemmataceae bacterium]